MSSSHDPAAALTDIIDNAGRVQRYLAGMTREAFSQDELVQDAVERCIERVCEAAHRLGAAAEALMPEQPWRDIRGMGNRLRHGYQHVDVNIIWATATLRLPELAAAAARARLRL